MELFSATIAAPFFRADSKLRRSRVAALSLASAQTPREKTRPFSPPQDNALPQTHNALFHGSWLILFLSITTNLAAQSLLTAFESEIATLVQTAQPSVVTVLAQKKGSENQGLFNLFGERSALENELTVGTGLIISSDGFLLTKDSIIRNAGTIEVALDNSTSHQVEWMARDSTRGIALLKISAGNLRPVRFNMADALQAGSLVTVIGNALGMPHAVSVGFVSAIQPDGLIQISANVDPGSNGSPVFDAHAHAIGIVLGRVGMDARGINANAYFSNTALVHPFADLLPFVRASLEQYYAQRGWIGVTVIMDATAPGHPRILRLNENGPGHRSGLQVGDTITHFDGKEVDAPNTLGLYVNQIKPGSTVPVKVKRLTQELTLEVRLAARTPIALQELNLASPSNSGVTQDHVPEPRKTNAPSPEVLQSRIDRLEKQVQALQNSFKRN